MWPFNRRRNFFTGLTEEQNARTHCKHGKPLTALWEKVVNRSASCYDCFMEDGGDPQFAPPKEAP